VSHILAYHEVSGNVWAWGPVCHVISDVVILSVPVQNINGALSAWTMDQEVLDRFRSAVNSSGEVDLPNRSSR
jgi:CRISPR/Cas system CMR subunit Cmr4 (Cas7 group RAMP superfamily)